MSLGALLSLTALGVSGFLAVYVLGSNPRGSANRAFVVLMSAFVLWDAAEAVQRAFPEGAPADAVEPFTRAVWVGISLVPAALVHLSLVYPEAHPALRRRAALVAVYAPFLAWAYLVGLTDFVIVGVSENFLGPSAKVAPTYDVMAALYAAWIYVGVALFLRTWWKTRGTRARRTQGLVSAGLVLGTIPAGVTEIFWPVLTAADTPLGLASLYTLVWSAIIAFAIARYHFLEIEPVLETSSPAETKHGLERGLNYLIVESGRTTAMTAFREVIATTPGLCVTGLPPARITKRFGLERTPILWVTASSSDERAIRPGALDFEILHTVLKFLRENPGTAVLLDDLDYVAELNGFDAVARFLRRVTNQASASGGTVLMAAGTGTFAPEQVAILRGIVDRVLEVLQAPPDRPTPDGDHVLLLASSSEAPDALALAGARGGLLITTEHPSKARRRFGAAYEILWLTESSDASASSARPTSLDAEAKRAVSGFVGARRGADVVIVGVEQLAAYNEFPPILAFVKDVLDLAGPAGCRVFTTLSPQSLKPRQIALLTRRFDTPVGPSGFRLPPSVPSTAAPGSRILYRGPVS